MPRPPELTSTNAHGNHTDCSICEHIPASQIANTGRDVYLPASVDPLKRLGLRRDEDLWRCPECDAFYVYTSEHAWTGSGNNDDDTLDRLPHEHAATVRMLLDGGDAELTPAQVDALFALPPLPHDLVLWRLFGRNKGMLRGAVGRIVTKLASMGFDPGGVDLRDLLCGIAALSPADARTVKAAIEATTYKTPHPFEHVLRACT